MKNGKISMKFCIWIGEGNEKRVLPVWRYLVHNLAMVDFAQPRVSATAAIELWLCSNPMARLRSSVDNLGMFGFFEKICFLYTYGPSSEIVMPHKILKINHICICSTQKGTFVPRGKFSRMRRENQF